MDGSTSRQTSSPSVQAMTPSHGHIRTRSGATLLICAALTTLALTGCANTTTVAPPTATPDREATPMFASDEDALAAAETAYRNYIDVSDQIARDGGLNVERLQPFVSVELYQQQVQEYADVASKGLRAVGSSMFDSFTLESYSREHDKIRVYVCMRVANIRVLDSANNDATPPDRNDDLPLQVAFGRSVESEPELSVTRSEVWSGKNFC